MSLDGAVIPNYPASSQDQAMTLGFERKGEQQRGRELRLRVRVVDGVERQSGFLAAAHDACMRMSREQTSFVACKGLPVPARGTILQIPLPSGLLGKPKWLDQHGPNCCKTQGASPAAPNRPPPAQRVRARQPLCLTAGGLWLET